jgi:hypothetical protein
MRSLLLPLTALRGLRLGLVRPAMPCSPTTDGISGRLALGATVMGDYTSFMIGDYEVTFARVRQGYVAVQCKRCLVICEKAGAEEGAIERWDAELLKTIKNHAVDEGQGLKHNKILTESLKYFIIIWR